MGKHKLALSYWGFSMKIIGNYSFDELKSNYDNTLAIMTEYPYPYPECINIYFNFNLNFNLNFKR